MKPIYGEYCKYMGSKKNFMAPFHGWGSTVSRLQSHYEETVNFKTQAERLKYQMTLKY